MPKDARQQDKNRVQIVSGQIRAENCGKLVNDALETLSGENLVEKLRGAGATPVEAKEYVQQYLDRFAAAQERLEGQALRDRGAAEANRMREEAVENAAWSILSAKVAGLERSAEDSGASGISKAPTLSTTILKKPLDKSLEEAPPSIPAAVLKAAPHLSSLRIGGNPHLAETWRLRKLYSAEKVIDPLADQMQRLRFAQPLPRSIWKNIIQDQYVDFEKLYASMDPGYDSDHVSACRALCAEHEWIRSYNAWEAATTALYPHRKSELVGYRAMVYDIFRAVPSDPAVAISFDVDARERYAKRPYLMDDMNELHVLLLGQIFRGVRHGPTTSSKRSHPGNFNNAPSKRAKVPCHNWNLGICKSPCPNRRRHGICSECGGDHRAKDVGACLTELQSRRRKGIGTGSAESSGEGSGRA